MRIDIQLHTPEGTVEVSGPLVQTASERAVLVDFGLKKIQVIKAFRAVTGFTLKDAKEAVEALPFVLTTENLNGVEGGNVVNAQRLLVEAGAICEIEGGSGLMLDILDLVKGQAR